MLLIDRVKLIPFDQANEMGELHGVHAIVGEQYLDSRNEVVEIGHLCQHVVSNDKISMAALGHHLPRGLDAVEARARTELGMIKDGETFYLVVDSRNDESDRPLPADSARSDGTRDDALPRPAQ